VTRYFVDIGEETFEVDISKGHVRIDGESVDADLLRLDGTAVWSLLVDGCSHRIVADEGAAAGEAAGVWNLRIGGESHKVHVVDERRRRIAELTGADDGPKGPAPILAPMPGLVMRIEVAEGDIVTPGQGVVIVEAMKMENELKADSDARVGRIHVAEGDAVEKDQLLIELESLQESEPFEESEARA
jgi:biotin carboxyl carrier protein